MNIAEQVLALEMPAGQFVVIGSGSLAALGIIPESSDIDLAVTPELFMNLEARGWERHQGFGGKTVLTQGDLEAGVNFADWTVEDLLADALYIDDVPYMSLQKLLAWKKAAGRDKDQAHIAAIEEYLKNSS